MENWFLLVLAAFVASTMAAIAGTGAGIVLLPVLAGCFGVREAIPIYAIAQLIGNLSRIGMNRSQISPPVVGWFAMGAIPSAMVGAWLFTKIPDARLLKILGIFLIATVVVRRSHPAFSRGFRVWWFAPIGGVFSVISAIVGSAGPFLAPFFVAFGLMKGAFIGTEALGTAIMHVSKLCSYQWLGVMSGGIWSIGLALGPVMIGGAYFGKSIMDRISTNGFLVIVDAMLVGFGVWFLVR